jgi:DNA-binding transcriptional regulator YhcF (GntR family)
MFKFAPIDRSDYTPPYLKLARQIEDAIAQGALKPQDRLPSLRRAGATLNLDVATVQKAYDVLERKGLLRKKGTLGAFVAPNADSVAGRDRETLLRRLARQLVQEGRRLGLGAERIQRLVKDELGRSAPG